MVAEKGQPPAASKSRSGNQKPTSAIEKPKRQLKADVGNSKIEAAIENQSKYLCGISKSPLHANRYSSQESIGRS